MHGGGLEGSGLGRSTLVVEQRHLAEQVARLHQRHHRFTIVDRLVGNRDAAAGHHEQIARGVSLVEQDVAPVELPLVCGGLDGGNGLVVEIGEQVDTPEQLGLHRAIVGD